MRREIFDAIKAARGKGYTPAEVALVDTLLDQLGVGRDEHAHKLADPAAFFAAVRRLTGPLDTTQVAVINAMLDKCAAWGLGWMAYGLATAWHEARLRPIEEIGKGKGRPYGAPGRNGGQIPYGRGLVQLTWDRNYEEADKRIGAGGALIADYALALRPDIAVSILESGMSKGWFSGKSLGTYIGGGRGTISEFTDARRIINGTDRAAMIADYAIHFQDALVSGGWA